MNDHDLARYLLARGEAEPFADMCDEEVEHRIDALVSAAQVPDAFEALVTAVSMYDLPSLRLLAVCLAAELAVWRTEETP